MLRYFLKYQAVFLLVLFLCMSFQTKSNAQEQTYTLGVVPQFVPLVIHENWTPIAEYLSKETGITIQLKSYKSIPEFEKALINAEIDFAYTNPYYFVMAHNAHGYIPLVHDASRKLTGILVMTKDVPFDNVQQLDGQTIVFPAPNAFAASHYIRALLAEKEKIIITPKYIKTHDNVYRYVALNEAVAGGGVYSTLKHQPEEIQNNLKIIYETPGVTPHPVAAHPRVPTEIQEKVINAMLKLSLTEKGQSLISQIPMHQPARSDYQRDYQYLDEMGLERYFIKDE